MKPILAMSFSPLTIPAFALLLFICPAWHASPASMYTVTRIPGLTANAASFGWAINESGAVTGWSQTSNGTSHALIYLNGVTSDLGALGDARTGSYGFAINNHGEVAGASDVRFGSPAEHAFLYSNGALMDLGTLGGLSSFPNGLNDLGQVVGGSGTADGPLRGFIYAGGHMTEIDDFIPAGINNQGQIIGFNGSDAVLYDHGTLTLLGSLGGQGSYPYHINERGDIAGASPTGTGSGGAFLYTGGHMISLGTTAPALPLSLAFGINNHRAVVGEVYNVVTDI